MISMIPRWAAALSFLTVFFSLDVCACRYTVRDVGFVDIAPEPYQLYCYVQEDTPEDLVSTFKRISYAVLLDSNIQTEVVHIDHQKDHPAMEYREFWEIDTSPSAILVSPEGQSRVVPISDTGEPFSEAVWSALEEVLSSPCREEILRHIVKAYCVVLLIDGKDADKNNKAHGEVRTAMDRITQIMDQMAKPSGEPPHLIRISSESFSSEKVLLWSLGLLESDVEGPHVAVLYGRARRLGPLLKGEEITESRVFNLLSLVGASCECGLDREWMMGMLLPLRWDEDVRSQVVDLAGFDAESPMVKTEISQILSMGPSSTSGGQGTVDPLDDFLYGYREQTVELEPVPVVAVESPDLSFDESVPESPDTVAPRTSYNATLFIISGMILLVLVIGAFIVLRSRRRIV
ncbi:MAG: hypothetical protein ABIH23_23580 [bacterium]